MSISSQSAREQFRVSYSLARASVRGASSLSAVPALIPASVSVEAARVIDSRFSRVAVRHQSWLTRGLRSSSGVSATECGRWLSHARCALYAQWSFRRSILGGVL